MKKIKITKLQRVDIPVEHQKEEGCIAYQNIKVVINFYGNLTEDILDTKILEDGRQVVIGGNGYIEDGYEISDIND
jgi:hypothetical protein